MLSILKGLRQNRVDTNAIFERLHYDISTLRYPPGTVLKEAELSGRFGVSRTPIRQVLQRLELSGLVQPVVGHGTVVTGIDLVSMRHLLEFRLQLAGLIRNFLSPAGFDRAVRSLREQGKRNAALADDFTPEMFACISHDIRMIVAEQITNPYLAQTWIDTCCEPACIWFLCLPTGEEEFSALQYKEISQLRQAFSSGRAAAVSDALTETVREWIEQVWRVVAIEGTPRDKL